MSGTILPGIKQFDLSGKAAIITGGSKGLGYAMASGLASAGANVILVNRNAGEGAQAAREISTCYPVEALSYTADITKKDQTESMAIWAMETFGRIDILINSAGINIRGPIEEVSPEDFNQVMDINVNGTWLCCRSVIPF